MTDDDPGDSDSGIPEEPNGHMLTELARTRERQSGGHALPAMRGAIGSFDYLMWSVGLSEGGYKTADPSDPETHWGITPPFAEAYYQATGIAAVPLKHWTLSMARDAYRVLIWEGPWVRCREVSAIAPVTGFVYGDACVNHAMRDAARLLQREVGVIPDGLVGLDTLNALAGKVRFRGDATIAIGLLCRRRDLYEIIMDRKPEKRQYRRGWMKRLNDVADRADLGWRWT
jgi:lysozyme family protein